MIETTIFCTYNDAIIDFCKVLLIALVMSVVSSFIGIITKELKNDDCIIFFTISVMVKTICLTLYNFMSRFNGSNDTMMIIMTILTVIIPSIICIIAEAIIGKIFIKNEMKFSVKRVIISDFYIVALIIIFAFPLFEFFFAFVHNL